MEPMGNVEDPIRTKLANQRRDHGGDCRSKVPVGSTVVPFVGLPYRMLDINHNKKRNYNGAYGYVCFLLNPFPRLCPKSDVDSLPINV